MPRKRKQEKPLDAYRRIRKPVPKPGRTIPDRRRKIREDLARKEAEEEEPG